MNERNLARCLEDGAGATIKSDSRFDAGLLGETVECLFKGVGAVGLLVRAGDQLGLQEMRHAQGNRSM